MRNVRFADKALERLETVDSPEYSEAIIRAFRLRMHLIRDAPDEREFYAFKSLKYKQLEVNGVINIQCG